jgi:hypothetical protein
MSTTLSAGISAASVVYWNAVCPFTSHPLSQPCTLPDTLHRTDGNPNCSAPFNRFQPPTQSPGGLLSIRSMRTAPLLCVRMKAVASSNQASNQALLTSHPQSETAPQLPSQKSTATLQSTARPTPLPPHTTTATPNTLAPTHTSPPRSKGRSNLSLPHQPFSLPCSLIKAEMYLIPHRI